MKSIVPDLRRCSDEGQLARALGVPADALVALSDPDEKLQYYVMHEIPKRRSGGARVVWEPVGAPVAEVHKNILRRCDLFLRDVVPGFPHDAAYGYVRGRSTRANAAVHCGSRVLLRADIKDFFPSISRERLAEALSSLDLNARVVDILTKVVTIYDELPQGLHSSPMWSNFVCLQLDLDLAALAAAAECRYTRYADDIAISGLERTPSKLAVSTILEKHGFKLAQRKFRVTKRGQDYFVTGLSVCDPTMPRVPKKFKRRLRQELYYAKKFGLESHIGAADYSSFPAGMNAIDGKVRYVRGVERETGTKFSAAWRPVLKGLQPAFVTRPGRPRRTVELLVDESELGTGEDKALALALVATEEPEALTKTAVKVLLDAQADPFHPGRVGRLDKKGLHYTDAHEQLRDVYSQVLVFLPFRGFVAFDRLEDVYQKTYLELLGPLLLARFKNYDRAEMKIVIEENSKIKLSVLKELVEKNYEALAAVNARRPIRMPTIDFGKKLTDPGLSVPDFMLGIFSDYVAATDRGTHTARFERLRDKYRLIWDKGKNLFYNRKFPFSSSFWRAD